MKVFPIPPSHRYGYQRNFGAQHKGTDIFAERGTPVRAVTDGWAYQRIETKGGKTVYLEGDDGVVYFYGHLDGWSLKMLRPGKQRVVATELIGTVGNTGNAEGKPPHLHFQMKRGTSVLDPFDALQDVDPGPPELGPGEPRPGGIDGKTLIALLVLWALSENRI